MSAAAMGGPEQSGTLDLTTVREALGEYLEVPGLLSIVSTLSWAGQCFPTTPSGLNDAADFIRDLDVQGAAGIYHRGTTVTRAPGRDEQGRRKRGKADITGHWTAFRLDLDHGKPGYAPDAQAVVDELTASPDIPAPSRWVTSGHGVYPVWDLEQPTEDGPFVRALVRDLYEAVAERFLARGWAIDPGIHSADRVWRVPGTINRRVPDEPRRCGWMNSTSCGAMHALDALRAAVPARPEHGLDRGLALPEQTDGLIEPIGRYFTMEQARKHIADYAKQPLLDVRYGQGVNLTLNNAAVVAGHFVPAFWTKEAAREYLIAVLLDGPGRAAGWTQADTTDLGTIESGLSKGMRHPYRRTGDASTPDGSEAVSVDLEAEETAEERRARRVAERVDAIMIEDEARREVARLKRAHRPSIAQGISDDLDDDDSPAMIMGSLIPADSIGFLAGRSGGYKSFLAVGWAACIATGRAWCGDTQFTVDRPRKVLYIAAEGVRGVKARARSWQARNGISLKGKLYYYDRPVHLNDESQAEELADIVREHGYEFLVVDTYHRSAPGTEENSSTDFGLIFEAVARLRDDFGCSVLFIDHTGKAGSAPRGTSAKEDDADYVLSTTYEGSRDASNVRTLGVRKLKDEETVGTWPLSLAPVDGQKMPVVTFSLAVEGASADLRLEWWRDGHEPSEAVSAAITAAHQANYRRGKFEAIWVWRALVAHTVPGEAATAAQVKAWLADVPDAVRVRMTASGFAHGVKVLKRAQVLEGRTDAKLIVEHHARSDHH